MSRVGRSPVILPQGVKVQILKDGVTVEGGGKSLKIPLWPHLRVKEEAGRITVERDSDDPKTRSFHGLCRALIQNAVTGVSKGWSKTLELNGVGYKAVLKGKVLELNLGYSHPISFPVPPGLAIKAEKPTVISVSGADKDLVGRTAHALRAFRPPEPYLGKGVKYTDEVLRRKAGKTGADKK